MMLYEVLNRLGIFRYTNAGQLVKEVVQGDFAISDGVISSSSLTLSDGQYYAILGSDMNDGVYQFGIDTLIDERFSGSVYVLRYNRAFFDLVTEMEEWNEKNGDKLNSPYTSESFGGYSYTKDSNASDVFKVFEPRLRGWKKA